MSRIGKQPVKLPDGVSIEITDDHLLVRGPKGELKTSTFSGFSFEIKDDSLIIKKTKSSEANNAVYGLLRSLVANAVEGVSKGFEKHLELVGTGYRAKKEGDKLHLTLGFSHPVYIEPIAGISLEVEGDKEIIVKGIDKQLVGQAAANIRSLRKPEPYKGKGIRYQGEIVRRKAGKATKVGAGE